VTDQPLITGRSARPYRFAYHWHRTGPAPWQMQLIGWMTGKPALERCPPGCDIPLRWREGE
jgi:hypothetical protein